MALHNSQLLRRIALPLLRRFNREVRITHHWTGEVFHCRLFEDKGYWYHGRARERRELETIQVLIPLGGGTVVEVGGHVGYLTLIFAHLIGPQGHVVVFEPSPLNLPPPQEEHCRTA